MFFHVEVRPGTEGSPVAETEAGWEGRRVGERRGRFYRETQTRRPIERSDMVVLLQWWYRLWSCVWWRIAKQRDVKVQTNLEPTSWPACIRPGQGRQGTDNTSGCTLLHISPLRHTTLHTRSISTTRPHRDVCRCAAHWKSSHRNSQQAAARRVSHPTLLPLLAIAIMPPV